MVGCEVRYSSLLRVVAHKDGDEERQHKNSAEQVENDEENTIASAAEVFGLAVDASNGHACEQDVRPAFLGNNLEKDEERVAKVVKVIVRVGSLPWRQNIPVEWRAVVLPNTVFEVSGAEIAIVAGFKLTDEDVQAVYGKRDQQAQRHKGCLQRLAMQHRGVNTNSPKRASTIPEL